VFHCGHPRQSLFDFAVDLEHYGRRILPLMKEAGLRL